MEREEEWGEEGARELQLSDGVGVEGEGRGQNEEGELGGVARGRYVTEGVGFRKGGQGRRLEGGGGTRRELMGREERQ